MSTSSMTVPEIAKALGISLDSSIGALLIGLILAAMYVSSYMYLKSLLTKLTFVATWRFYGVTLIQCYHYFDHSHRDSKYMKSIVRIWFCYVYSQSPTNADNQQIGLLLFVPSLCSFTDRTYFYYLRNSAFWTRYILSSSHTQCTVS